MPAPHPRMHGLTHAPGGPDPIPNLAGDGIQFDVSPQEGGFLEATTTTAGIYLTAETDINLDAGDDITLIAHTPYGLTKVELETGGGSVTITTPGPGGFTVKLKDAAAQLLVYDDIGNPIFRIDQDGSLHGLTGQALTFDL